MSQLVLAVLTLLLTLSTFVRVPPGLFVAFTLTNGIIQAGAGGYLQTSVVVVGALFGPAALQAVMAGQAAVAIIVSGVQVISTTLSVWGQTPSTFVMQSKDGKEEETSAFMFFALSTLFLLFSTGSHMWLVTMPAYKTAMSSHERHKSVADINSDSDTESEETRGLVSSGRRESSDSKAQIIRIAKSNLLVEIAIWYTFVSTLVSNLSVRFYSVIDSHLCRPCFLPSL